MTSVSWEMSPSEFQYLTQGKAIQWSQLSLFDRNQAHTEAVIVRPNPEQRAGLILS